MKWQRCFIDGDGNIWRTETLKKASEKLPIVMFDIRTISRDEKIRWRLDNLRDYLNHYTRASNVNLETPIILRPDGYVMDGWHRIIKALYLCQFHLPARQFVKTPKPDFSVQG